MNEPDSASADASMAIRSPSPEYQTISPTKTTASEYRSSTESRNAPNAPAVPAALATAPSRKSSALTIRNAAPPTANQPCETSTATSTLSAKPRYVSQLACMPARASATASGCTAPRNPTLNERIQTAIVVYRTLPRRLGRGPEGEPAQRPGHAIRSRSRLHHVRVDRL